MSATVRTTEMVKVPESAALARELPSDVLYQLEAAGHLATEILDERVIEWTQEGWAQRKIAAELGCSHVAIGKRQARLGIEPSQPKRASGNPVTTSEDEPEIVDAEPVPDEPQRRPRTPRVDEDRAAHYLPDLVSEDADYHPRTQALNWFDQGQRLQGLLSNRTPLTVRSDEDRAAMEKEAVDMARLATRLKEAIHYAVID